MSPNPAPATAADAGDTEAIIRRRRDDRHEIAILSGWDLTM